MKQNYSEMRNVHNNCTTAQNFKYDCYFHFLAASLLFLSWGI